MVQTGKHTMSDYQLRSAAGTFFLLSMNQKGLPYEKPLQLNRIAAELWILFLEGNKAEQVVNAMVQKYGVSEAEIREDMQLFCRQMNELGITIEE